MIKNFFITAWRNFVKGKMYSFINLIGLSSGMCMAFLIGLWIWDEISFNRTFDHYDTIVRIKQNSTYGNETNTWDAVPVPLADALRTQYSSDFKKLSLTSTNAQHILHANEKYLRRHGMFVQPEFIDIFSVKPVKGSLTGLNEPSSVVINESLSKALFGNENPVGKNIQMDNSNYFEVKGVFADFPYSSDFRTVNFLLPWVYYVNQPEIKASLDSWANNSFQIFGQLHTPSFVDNLSGKIKGLLNGYGRTDKPEVLLHPMNKWHLYGEFRDGKNIGGDVKKVWMFAMIGIFVLLLACINFMNLSTARGEKRAKEVGIRKAVGSLRKQLVFQFLSESVLLSLIASVICMLLVTSLLPLFNHLADKEIQIGWSNSWFWFALLVFAIATGVVAGSYPAFYLSSFSPVKTLKGKFKSEGPLFPRRILVVTQLIISIQLVIFTVVVYQQIRFAKDRPAGYSTNSLVSVSINNGEFSNTYDRIRDELIKSGTVTSMAASSSPPTELWVYDAGFSWLEKDPNLFPSFGTKQVTFGFGETIGWKIVEGRDFSRERSTDSNAVVINQSAVRYMGLKDPIGKTIRHEEDDSYANYTIIGVVEDMIVESPYAPAKPLIYMIGYKNLTTAILKLNPRQGVANVLPVIELIFEKHNPSAPFEFTFTDDDYAEKFKDEMVVGNVAELFTVFAVVISCLGLFALASFMAQQRKKEISIRKVLGATVTHLWTLLSVEFLILVVISLCIAMPLAYYLAHSWLQNYSYRTNIQVWVFVVTGLAVFLITLATVSMQTLQAATVSPVKTLRSE